ncbi:MAG: hypothetical protein JO102_06530, partial [Elusimicrobia bacterium]|nr:hypothetical protein [Elusimicrobiota bacterium]
ILWQIKLGAVLTTGLLVAMPIHPILAMAWSLYLVTTISWLAAGFMYTSGPEMWPRWQRIAGLGGLVFFTVLYLGLPVLVPSAPIALKLAVGWGSMVTMLSTPLGRSVAWAYFRAMTGIAAGLALLPVKFFGWVLKKTGISDSHAAQFLSDAYAHMKEAWTSYAGDHKWAGRLATAAGVALIAAAFVLHAPAAVQAMAISGGAVAANNWTQSNTIKELERTHADPLGAYVARVRLNRIGGRASDRDRQTVIRLEPELSAGGARATAARAGLENILGNSTPGARAEALQMIERLNLVELAPAVAQVAANDQQPALRLLALRVSIALGRDASAAPSTVNALAAAMVDTDRQVQAAAMAAIQRTGFDPVALLEISIEGTNRPRRLRAVERLGRLGADPDYRDAARRALDDAAARPENADIRADIESARFNLRANAVSISGSLLGGFAFVPFVGLAAASAFVLPATPLGILALAALLALPVLPMALFISQAIRIAASRRAAGVSSNLISVFATGEAVDVRAARLPAAARDAADRGEIAFVFNGTIYADKARLSALPQTLQRSIYDHEIVHQRGTASEFLAFARQAIGFPALTARAIALALRPGISTRRALDGIARVARSDRSPDRKKRFIEDLIDGSPLDIGLEQLRDNGNGSTGLWAGDVSETVSGTLTEIGVALPAAQRIRASVGEGLREILTGRREEGLVAGSLGAITDEASQMPGLQVLVRYLPDGAVDALEEQVRAQTTRSEDGPSQAMKQVFVAPTAEAREHLEEKFVDLIAAGRVRFTERSAGATLSSLVSEMTSGAAPLFSADEARRAQYRFFFTPGLDLSGFIDVPDADQWQLRFFVLITAALNPVAVEVRAAELNQIDALIRTIESQA